MNHVNMYERCYYSRGRRKLGVSSMITCIYILPIENCTYWRGLEADDSAGFEGLGYTEHEGFDKRSHEEEEEEVTSWVPRGLAVLLREVRDLWLWGWVGGRGFVKGGCMVLEQLGFREDGVLGGLCQR